MKNFDLPTSFLSYLNTGNIKITCDEMPAINFIVEADLKIIDVIDIPIKITKMPGLFKQLSEAKDLAKKLKDQKITLEVRLQGQAVIKLGMKANPKLAKIITLSNDIEITDLKKLKKLNDIF